MRSKLVWGYSFEEAHEYALKKLKKNIIKDLDPFYVFFDFETNGCGDLKSQRAIELAWVITNRSCDILTEKSYYFSNIANINAGFHGEKVVESVKNSPHDNKEIMKEFIQDLHLANSNNGALVAHNIAFDLNQLYKECDIYNISYNIENMDIICTMKQSKTFCNIEHTTRCGHTYIKFPKLSELYVKCFDLFPSLSLHKAIHDVKIMVECFAYMKKHNVI